MRLATLNLEGKKHLVDQLAWVRQSQPDVLCVQECFRSTLPEFESLGYTSFFAAYAKVPPLPDKIAQYGDSGLWGLAILTRLPVVSLLNVAYRGALAPIPVQSTPNSLTRVVQIITVDGEERQFTVANTHATWTPNGQPTDEQLHDLGQLLALLETQPSLLLCGDFNAPRGMAAWSMLTEHFTDNVPPEVTTTIDGDRHLAGPLPYVVDGIFSTSDCQVEDVRVHRGISDHCGLTCILKP